MKIKWINHKATDREDQWQESACGRFVLHCCRYNKNTGLYVSLQYSEDKSFLHGDATHMGFHRTIGDAKDAAQVVGNLID